jgi:hypothetical protein
VPGTTRLSHEDRDPHGDGEQVDAEAYLSSLDGKHEQDRDPDQEPDDQQDDERAQVDQAAIDEKARQVERHRPRCEERQHNCERHRCPQRTARRLRGP